MKIQQAIFTSSDRGQIKGYQLVATSPAIDRHVSKELHRWSPSHMADDDPANWTINYFPISDEFVAVARTVLGGPEYSSRGGLQVVTLIAVLDNRQFSAYDHNALLVAQTALALGHLRLPRDLPNRLEPFELPEQPVQGSGTPPRGLTRYSPAGGAADWQAAGEDAGHEADEFSLLEELQGLLAAQQRLAIIGARDPLDLAGKLIAGIAPEQRREFSFTTGLPPAQHRPFQAHFLANSDRALNQLLKAEGIAVIPAQPSLARL